MRKALSYILPIIAAYCASIPPIDFRLKAPLEHWPLIIVFTGFFGVYLLFLRVPLAIKIISICSLVSCFFSAVPYIAFSAYVSIILCCYFFVGALNMDSWAPTFKMMGALLILNLLFMAAQFFSQDQLLNFGLSETICFGVVGQHMQSASFIVILSAVLVLIHPGFLVAPIIVALFCNSSWALCCVGIGIMVYFPSKLWKSLGLVVLFGFLIMGMETGKFHANLFVPNSRWDVWIRGLELLKDYPWTGWGPGVYKILFPALSQVDYVIFKTAHNDWVQLLMEFGYPMFVGLLLMIGAFFWMLKIRSDQTNDRRLISGFAMIACDMMVHFPTRMIQCVFLIIFFLAYCYKNIRHQHIYF